MYPLTRSECLTLPRFYCQPYTSYTFNAANTFCVKSTNSSTEKCVVIVPYAVQSQTCSAISIIMGFALLIRSPWRFRRATSGMHRQKREVSFAQHLLPTPKVHTSCNVVHHAKKKLEVSPSCISKFLHSKQKLLFDIDDGT